MGFNVENYFSETSNGTPIVFYKGNIDSDLINNILDKIEEVLISSKEPSKLRKKVYNVLVESLQNLYHHVDKVPEEFEDQLSERYAILSVSKVGKDYRIITGNFIQAENVVILEDKIKRINESTHEQITDLYKFILNNQRISAKGGGGLGLVDIARKTGNKLNYRFQKYDDKTSFFCLDILVSEKN
jgi:hypothetical protein